MSPPCGLPSSVGNSILLSTYPHFRNCSIMLLSVGMFSSIHSWLMWSKHPFISPSRIHWGDFFLASSLKIYSAASCAFLFSEIRKILCLPLSPRLVQAQATLDLAWPDPALLEFRADVSLFYHIFQYRLFLKVVRSILMCPVSLSLGFCFRRSSTPPCRSQVCVSLYLLSPILQQSLLHKKNL